MIGQFTDHAGHEGLACWWHNLSILDRAPWIGRSLIAPGSLKVKLGDYKKG